MIGTFNAQLVAVRGDQVIVMIPRQMMTADEALRHAAWLVVLAEALSPAHSLEEYLAAVRST